MGSRRGRAAPLSAQERRAALIEATFPLLVEHGRTVTSRQIADAAGVAEGTIYKAFATKEELIDATIADAFQAGQILERVAEIDPLAPLRERAIALVALLQDRFTDMFALMRALGLVTPPDLPEREAHELSHTVQATRAAMVAVLEPDRHRFGVAPAQVLQLLRLLTFSGSHPDISGGQVLSPDQIVDTVLYGVVQEED